MDRQKHKYNLAGSSLLKAIKVVAIIILLFLSHNETDAQINITNVGAGFGFGSLSSNSPAVTSFGGNLSIDFKLWFSEEVRFRLGYLHLRDADYIFSGSKLISNYPFINSYSLRGMLEQPITHSIFIEEGIGLLYLNNQFIIGKSKWDIGTVFHLMPHFFLNRGEPGSMKLGIKIEYGFTFGAETTNYYLFALQSHYYFN